VDENKVLMKTTRNRRPVLSRLLGCLILSVGVTLLAVAAQAAPVWGEKYSLAQPDGSTVDVRIWGDEYYRIVESPDGYTLIRDAATGVICYARLSADGQRLEATGWPYEPDGAPPVASLRHLRPDPAAVRAVRALARDQAREQGEAVLAAAGMAAERIDPPSTGRVRGICLIVDFADLNGAVPPENIADYCNLYGYSGYGNNGSVRDYFYEVSDGNLEYTNYVPEEYYRADRVKTYYDDCSVPFGVRAREMVLEALHDLDEQGFDFSQYDTNGDGLIDAINCFYAGSTQCGWSWGLWPHTGSISFSADGVEAFRYQITGLSNRLTLATFCHENGHMLCSWPDLYDYDGDSRGVGTFCLMCASASLTNPSEPCAYMKETAGWANVVELETHQEGLVATAGTNTLYRYSHPEFDNEYYLIENRQQVGRDQTLADAGLAIWHVDTEGNNSDQDMTPESHYLVTLVQADGRWDLEYDRNSGDDTDLWAAPTYRSFTPSTYPNSNWWNNRPSGLAITDISTISRNMTFTFAPEGAVAVPGAESAIPVPGTIQLYAAVPNPFNPRTAIHYYLPTTAPVSLHIFDLAGRVLRVLRDGATENAGEHRLTWDGRDDHGRNLPSGTYLYRLESGPFQQTRRMVMIR